MNILTSVERAARARPDRLAVRFGDVQVSHAGLLDDAARFGGFLAARGVRSGDRVAIFLHNDVHWLPALFGIWKAGAVAVPLNYLFPPAPLRHAASDSGAVLVVALASDVPRLREALDGLPLVDRIVATTPVEGAAYTWADALAVEPLPRTVPRLDGDDALIMYTSGSTGVPKGVRQTHRNTAAECEAVIDAWRFGPDDHALICTPLFHVGGLQLMALPLLLVGASVTLRRWQVREWLDDVVALRPSYVALVPAMLIDVVNLLRDEELVLDSVRVCAVGGSAMPEARLKSFTASTGIVPVNIYGQTEQSGLSITEPLDEDRRAGSLGRPLEQIVECLIAVPGEQDPVALGEIGELLVRGDAVTPGYWRLPDVDAEKLTADGWLRTGDLVRADRDGYLYYLERTDDMIISGGENVYPQMVEGHLQTCPLVAEVTVIGTPHERLIEQVTAIVMPADPGVSAEDVAAWCETQPDLRGIQRPRRIEIVDAIPRTATNKIDRPVLKRLFG